MKKSDLEQIYDAALKLELERPSNVAYSRIEDTQLMTLLLNALIRLQRAELEYLFNIDQNSKDAGNKQQLTKSYTTMVANLLRFGIAHKLQLDSINEKAPSSEL